jgi:hypothetical protein
MAGADGIAVAEREQALVRGARRRLHESVVLPGGFGRVHVTLGRDDVEIAREDDGDIGLAHGVCVRVKALHPAELVFEAGAGLGIAVGRVETRDQHPAHGPFDVATLGVVARPGENAARDDGVGALGQDRDAVVGALGGPRRAIAGLVQGRAGEASLLHLELLQTHHVG